MTRLGKWWRRRLERWAGRFYEGPQPPERLGEMVIEFANLHPRASRGEWVHFASEMAAEAYRSGWTRGWEQSERDPDGPPWRQLLPDDVADQLDPDWRWSPDITLLGPADVIPDPEAPLPEQLDGLLLRELTEQGRDDDDGGAGNGG